MLYSHLNRWEEIYDRYRTELSAFVSARIDADSTEDVLQDIWAALSVTLEREDLTDPRAWLYRVARNRITDTYRKQASRLAFVDLTETDEPAASPDTYPDADAVQAEIDAALDLLPAKQREVFVRNAIGGETLREIAGDLGVPLRTVISRKGYARNRLQEFLRELYEDYFGFE